MSSLAASCPPVDPEVRSVGCSPAHVALLSPAAEMHSHSGPPASPVPAAAEPEITGGYQVTM